MRVLESQEFSHPTYMPTGGMLMEIDPWFIPFLIHPIAPIDLQAEASLRGETNWGMQASQRLARVGRVGRVVAWY